MIGITSKGDGRSTKTFLDKLKSKDAFRDLDRYGQMGVEALAAATPLDTGETANSWAYRINQDRLGPRIEWYNTNSQDGITPVAVLIQYGHATGTGGYVMGMDYINPAMRPIFDRITDEIWKKVKR